MVVCTGAKSFLRGVGPRALSNGLNSGIFFCFFELLKQVGISGQLPPDGIGSAFCRVHQLEAVPVSLQLQAVTACLR